MKILPPEPQVKLYEEGFGERDLLGRKKVGQALSDLSDRIEDSLVIALDGEWGTGKSYFLKRWVGAHVNENDSKATTIYFDAFEHDYLNDPLPALVSALIDRLPAEKEDKAKKVKEAAFKLAKPIARIALNLATLGATEALGDVADVVIEAAGDEAAASLENYWQEETGRRAAMTEFKDAIEALTAPTDEDDTASPLVIVIDELDRCRPDYALEVLEVIKHFFSVPYVHFILGVNLRALENSVQARYGGNTNGQAYLKKFIQISLKLPDEVGDEYNKRSAILVYLQYLIKEMKVPQHIAEPLKNQISILSKYNHFSMRDIGKIVSSINIINGDVLASKNWKIAWVYLMIDLIISKIIRPDIHIKLLNATANKEELAEYFGATSSTIEQELNGEHNPNYNGQIRISFLTWLYIVQNGQLEIKHEAWAEHIKRGLDDYGHSSNVRGLPMKLHRMWVERFSFYKPE